MKHSLHQGAGALAQQRAGWGLLSCHAAGPRQQSGAHSQYTSHHRSGSRSMTRTMQRGYAKVSQGRVVLWLAAFKKAGLTSASRTQPCEESQNHNSLSEDCIDGRLPDHQLSMRPAEAKGFPNGCNQIGCFQVQC